MSARSMILGRSVEVDQFLSIDGVLYFWNAIKNEFVEKESGKVLSTNDFTDEEKQQLAQLVAGGGKVTWDKVENKPVLYTKEEIDTQRIALLNQVNTTIAEAVSSVYRYAGTVPSYSNLPTYDLTPGDVYNVEDTDMNYAWVGEKGDTPAHWDPLASTFKVEPIPNSVIDSIVNGTYGG